MRERYYENGIFNPCAICGKSMPKGREKFVTCQELNFSHGKDCNCYLAVGTECYKKIKKNKKNDAFRKVLEKEARESPLPQKFNKFNND